MCSNTTAPVNPGKIDWSGENPCIFLKEDAEGPFSALAAFFRIIYSPFGPGKAAIVIDEPSNPKSEINCCFTNNMKLAEYLTEDFAACFLPFKESAAFANIKYFDNAKFEHSGDTRGEWIEKISADNTQITLKWTAFIKAFMAELRGDKTPTGKHDMLSLFVPAKEAEISVNGKVLPGKTLPKEMHGKAHSSAFLALSETWIKN